MAESSDPSDKIYTLKTQMRESDRDAKMQLLLDRFGDCTEYYQKNTIFKHSRITIQVTEELNDDPQAPLPNFMTMTSLSAYCKTKDLTKNVFYQKIVVSKVAGNALEFLQSIGEKEDRHWIERGHLFKDEKIQIRVFQIYDDNGNNLYPGLIGVVFEAIRPSSDIQEVICNSLYNAYQYLLDGETVYQPTAI